MLCAMRRAAGGPEVLGSNISLVYSSKHGHQERGYSRLEPRQLRLKRPISRTETLCPGATALETRTVPRTGAHASLSLQAGQADSEHRSAYLLAAASRPGAPGRRRVHATSHGCSRATCKAWNQFPAASAVRRQFPPSVCPK
ncbi:hypothetical protein HPB47_008300 [Ixodes persulcatus]|uniref:Uncharacterized protein n=1 Tax=Ixodes persulcatus TaxID=34615 RepID=A0AC60P545_IXOPE|nr:hypothetical protein HPB47_008300 [Ixodes persulcatus]